MYFPCIFRELGAWSEGYSCADIITVVNETLMQSVRKIQDATYFKKVLQCKIFRVYYSFTHIHLYCFTLILFLKDFKTFRLKKVSMFVCLLLQQYSTSFQKSIYW